MTAVGYARVSTKDQSLESQVDALRGAGAERIFTDKASSRNPNRDGWASCRSWLRDGDTLIVWRLDRLSGTLTDLIEIVGQLGDEGIDIRSLTEPAIDTTTAAGKMLFQMMAALNEFRIDLIRENTRAGLASARAAGRHGGRPRVVTPQLARRAHELQLTGATLLEIGKQLHVSESSVRRALLLWPDR